MTYKIKKKPENRGFIELYGIHTVLAALNNKKRIHKKLIISKNHKEIIDNKLKRNIGEIVLLHNKEMLNLSKKNQPVPDRVLPRLIILLFPYIVSGFQFHSGARVWVRQNQWIYWSCFGTTLICLIAMACCESVRRNFPTNIIFLSIFVPYNTC